MTPRTIVMKKPGPPRKKVNMTTKSKSTKTTRKRKVPKVKITLIDKVEVTDNQIIYRLPDWVKDINVGSVIVRKDNNALVKNNNFKEYNKFGLVMWHSDFVEQESRFDYKQGKIVVEEYIDLKLFGVDASANTTLGKFRLTASIANRCALDADGSYGFIDTFTKRRMMDARTEIDKLSTALFYAQERLINLRNLRVKYGLSNEDEELNV